VSPVAVQAVVTEWHALSNPHTKPAPQALHCNVPPQPSGAAPQA
jgi:hypothetical protein